MTHRPAQLAVEVVARHFSKVPQPGSRLADGRIVIEGRAIDLVVSTVRPCGPSTAKPRLRFDRVVLEVMGRLKEGLSGVVPDRKLVVVTMTAPIRLASKTTITLHEEIRALLARRSAEPRFGGTINQNRVQVRVMKAPAGAAKLIGFVHSADSDPNVIFNVAASLLRCIGSKGNARRRRTTHEDRWLIIAGEDNSALIDTYRKVYSQLFASTEFSKVLLVSKGRVETLLTQEPRRSPRGARPRSPPVD